MCGRYTLTTDLGYLAERFAFPVPDVSSRPRYNVAPTDQVLCVVRGRDEQRGGLLRWGLIPHWAKDTSSGARMINARMESLTTSAAFRAAFRARRCLVPADSFFEWRRPSRGAPPVRYVVSGEGPFAFAGLWAAWKSPEGEWVRSCTIITCPSNELVAQVHDRMPVILREHDEDLWLDPAMEDPATVLPLLAPYPAALMDAYQVSPLVNSVKNDEPACIERA